MASIHIMRCIVPGLGWLASVVTAAEPADLFRWDIQFRTEWNFHLSVGEVSSAIPLGRDEYGKPSHLLAIPDSPVGVENGKSDPQAVLIDLHRRVEQPVTFAAPFNNEDIECAVVDPVRQEMLLLNSGSGRTSAHRISVFSAPLRACFSGTPIPCREWIIDLSAIMSNRSHMLDVEAGFILGDILYLIEKTTMGTDPSVYAVDLQDCAKHTRSAREIGVLVMQTPDDLPLMDWITDAAVLHKDNHAPRLYLLGYRGVYEFTGSVHTADFPHGSLRTVAAFPGTFKPQQTDLAETLVMLDEDAGYIIKEYGRNALTSIVASPVFSFSSGRLGHSGSETEP